MEAKEEKKRMQLYLAPMEGLTGYVYRNAYHKHFGEIDRYFTPFIANKKMSCKEIRDILPENNKGMDVVPQILTNRAEEFICIAKELKEYGYRTVNLNLGCPSGTVVAKYRGSGFLAVPDELDAFLEEIFEACPLAISIKTRIGKESPAEWEHLLGIYEKYPLEELIVHPRVQTDYYKKKVRPEAFGTAVEQSCHALCYNGDICTTADYAQLMEQFPQITRVMIGRGILKNPYLPGEIRARAGQMQGSAPAEIGQGGGMTGGILSLSAEGNNENEEERKERLLAFHDDILSGYQAIMSGDTNTLFKMKELWGYLSERFENPEKYIKKIRKSQRIAEYLVHVDALFREQPLRNA